MTNYFILIANDTVVFGGSNLVLIQVQDAEMVQSDYIAKVTNCLIKLYGSGTALHLHITFL